MQYKKCKCAKCGSAVLRVNKRNDVECFDCRILRKRECARRYKQLKRDKKDMC